MLMLCQYFYSKSRHITNPIALASLFQASRLPHEVFCSNSPHPPQTAIISLIQAVQLLNFYNLCAILIPSASICLVSLYLHPPRTRSARPPTISSHSLLHSSRNAVHYITVCPALASHRISLLEPPPYSSSTFRKIFASKSRTSSFLAFLKKIALFFEP